MSIVNIWQSLDARWLKKNCTLLGWLTVNIWGWSWRSGGWKWFSGQCSCSWSSPRGRRWATDHPIILKIIFILSLPLLIILSPRWRWKRQRTTMNTSTTITLTTTTTSRSISKKTLWNSFLQNEEDFENVFHPLHSYMYDVPGYPDLSCASNLKIKVLSAKFGYSKSSFAEASHPCVFDFTSQYQAGQCVTNRLSLSLMGCPVRCAENHSIAIHWRGQRSDPCQYLFYEVFSILSMPGF